MMACAAQFVRQQKREDPGGLALTLYYGLLAPPLAWCAQECLGFGLASHAGFPESAPRASFLQGYTGVWTALLGVNLALLVVSRARPAFLRPRSGTDANRPAAPATDLLDPRESRIRVFAASGLFVAILFAIAIGVNTISLTTLSTCSVV